MSSRTEMTADDVRRLTEKLHRDRLLHSCLTCKNFTEATEGCALAQGERPPARVIAYGCSAWEDENPLPF
jgi:hypothetical protein